MASYVRESLWIINGGQVYVFWKTSATILLKLLFKLPRMKNTDKGGIRPRGTDRTREIIESLTDDTSTTVLLPLTEMPHVIEVWR